MPLRAQTVVTSTPRQRFAADPQAVCLSRIRGFARDYLTLYCAEQRTVEDMVLCVDEACTNAISHGGSAEQIEIFLGFQGDDLRVLVKDRGRGFDTAAFDPEPAPDPASERGRGLFLMSRLCDEMTLNVDGGLEVLLVMRAVRRAPSPAEGPVHASVGTRLPHRAAEAERDGYLRALSDSERRFRALFENMAEGVALCEVVDEGDEGGRALDLRILDANPAFERHTGCAVEHVRGQLVSELSGAGDTPHLAEYARVAAGGEPFVCVAACTATERRLRVAAVCCGPDRFAAIVEDLTDRKSGGEEGRAPERCRATTEELGVGAAEPEVSRERPLANPAEVCVEAREPAARAGLDDALDALDSLVGSTLELSAILQGSLDEAVRALSCDAGAIELREGSVWVVRWQCGLDAAQVGLRLTRSQAPNATRAVAYRQPFATADMQAAATDVGLAATHGLRSVLTVPLLSDDVVTGCLLLYGRSVRVFSDAELDFARRLGAKLSPALENARSDDL